MPVAISYGFLLRGEEAGDDVRGLVPLAGFPLELRRARPREPVVAGLTIVFGDAPFGGNGALLLQFDERRVERAVVDQEAVAADLLNPAGDAVPVQGAHGVQSLQDHQGEGALADIDLLSHMAMP